MLSTVEEKHASAAMDNARVAAERRADDAEHRCRDIEARSQLRISELEAKLSNASVTNAEESGSLAQRLADKDKEIGELGWELQKARQLLDTKEEGGQSANDAAVSEAQEQLRETEGVLNHAQKRIIILETSLEKEAERREKLEVKITAMKKEIAELGGGDSATLESGAGSAGGAFKPESEYERERSPPRTPRPQTNVRRSQVLGGGRGCARQEREDAPGPVQEEGLVQEVVQHEAGAHEQGRRHDGAERHAAGHDGLLPEPVEQHGVLLGSS
jgi:hypothetical protein